MFHFRVPPSTTRKHGLTIFRNLPKIVDVLKALCAWARFRVTEVRADSMAFVGGGQCELSSCEAVAIILAEIVRRKKSFSKQADSDIIIQEKTNHVCGTRQAAQAPLPEVRGLLNSADFRCQQRLAQTTITSNHDMQFPPRNRTPKPMVLLRRLPELVYRYPSAVTRLIGQPGPPPVRPL